MKDIFSTLGKILGFVFASIVIGFTGYLTWLLSQRLVPDNTILQLMTLALFDGGALVWFLTFVTVAKGTLQWAFAGIGFLVGLAGAIIMAAGELVLGQKLVVVDDPTKIGWILVMTVILAALAHASLIYAFHFSDPHTKNRIENAQKVSQAIERAYQDARGEIDRNVDQLVAGLVESVVHEARQQIGAATALHIRAAAQLEEKAGETLRGGPVVDGQAKDAATPPTRKRKRGLFDFLGNKRTPAPIPVAPAPDNLPGGFDFAKLAELYDMLKSQQPAQETSQDTGVQTRTFQADAPAVTLPTQPPADPTIPPKQ